MKILIAPDKFKGSVTARQACAAIEAGLRLAKLPMEIRAVPLADGGDGTLGLLLDHFHGRKIEVEVLNPVGRLITASFGVSGDSKTAFVEMAEASGMKVVSPGEMDIMASSSFGTGQLLDAALEAGVTDILLGIGGSATNDAGLGASEALGYRFFDGSDRPIRPAGGNLALISRIETANAHPRLREVAIQALCDVTFPFAGPSGAAHTFAPQKGATPSQVLALDAGLENVRKLLITQFGTDVQSIPGTGAGGGLPAAAEVLWGARIRKGIEVVFSLTELARHVEWADAVITGEGRVDEQSLNGKVFDGIRRLCRKFRKKLIVIAGDSSLTAPVLQEAGADLTLTLTSETSSAQVAIRDAEKLLPALGRRAAEYLAGPG
jgi:glycerate kinase